MAVLMKDAPPEAVDMVLKLMDFNPERRLDIEGALKHPYMATFVTGSEPSCPGRRTLPPSPAPALLAPAHSANTLLPASCADSPSPSTTTTNSRSTTIGKSSTSR